jgi:quercetin dioxygenase-like cupin family protein
MLKFDKTPHDRRRPRSLQAGLPAGLLAGLVLVAAGWAARAQTTPTPQAQPSTMANFTGGVRNVPATELRTVRFQYDAGARSYWHVHDGIQLLLPEAGTLRYQLQGQKMRDVAAGQPVFLPPNVPHWHGATPDQGMTQISVSVGTVKWMAEVSSDEYLGRK